jgi:hypothetical protein
MLVLSSHLVSCICIEKSALAKLRGGGTMEAEMERSMDKCDLPRLKRLIQKAQDIDFDGEVVSTVYQSPLISFFLSSSSSSSSSSFFLSSSSSSYFY